MGYFSLRIDANPARTLLPTEPDFATYKLSFTPDSASGNPPMEDIVRPAADLSEPILLYAGTWELWVGAYTDTGDDPQLLTAQGTLTFDIDGADVTDAVILKPIPDGKGTFSWKINYPDNFPAGITMTSANMNITPYAPGGTGASETLDITEPSASGVTTLDAGYYRVGITLTSSEGKTAPLTRVLHIQTNMVSEYTHTFTASNFSAPLTGNGTVRIEGTVNVGGTLTAVTEFPAGTTGHVYYQWKRLIAGTTTNITGEISSTYTVRPEDTFGTEIFVEVYRAGYSGSITSPAVTVNAVWVSSIEAVYVQGGAVIYPDTPMENLKAGLTVTAVYNDGDTEPVLAADYELTAGTLPPLPASAGDPWLRPITVYHNGRTTTFSVTLTPAVFIGTTPYATLANAIGQAQSGDTITLEADITVTSPITVGNKEITIVSESGGAASSMTISLGANGNMFTLGSGGKLILGDDDPAANKLTLQGIDGNDASLITVNNGGTLEMNDSAVITGNKYLTSSNVQGGGVRVNGGTFNMSGGLITECSGGNAGAIYVSGGTVNLSGDSVIMDNTANNQGGAIFVLSGTLNIEDYVRIHSNTAASSGAISIGGSFSGATLNMYGGFIYNNEATYSTSGGGVNMLSGSTFNFYGGIIYGTDGLTQTHSPREEPNRSPNSSRAALFVDGGTARYGDGVGIGTSAITIVGKPPLCDYITAVFDPTALTVYPDTPVNSLKAGLTVTAHFDDGSPSNPVPADDYSLTAGTLTTSTTPWVRTVNVSYGGRATTFVVDVSPITAGGMEYTTLDAAINGVPSGTVITLKADIALTSGVDVDGKEITIVSESGDTTISLGANGSMFTIKNNGNLILGDGDPTNTLTLEGRDNNNAVLVSVDSGGTLEMYDGAVITGNNNTVAGGVHVASGGEFYMHGGKIIDCTSRSGNGGALAVSGGTAVISGNAEISGNHANTVGGAVFVTNGGDLTIEGNASINNNTSGNGAGGIRVNDGTVTMTGGSVSNNRTTSGNGGGGVSVSGTGVFNLSGGVISGNISAGPGGGVRLAQGGTLNFYGGIIYGNEASGGLANIASSGAALEISYGDGTALYGDGDTITTTNVNTTIEGRP